MIRARRQRDRSTPTVGELSGVRTAGSDLTHRRLVGCLAPRPLRRGKNAQTLVKTTEWRMS